MHLDRALTGAKTTNGVGKAGLNTEVRMRERVELADYLSSVRRPGGNEQMR